MAENLRGNAKLMLKKCLILFALILPILGLGLIIFPIRTPDFALYEELLKSSTPEDASIPSAQAQQKRERVSKQIWYQDDTPLYCRIDSAESELFLFHEHNTTEVVEELKDVACFMQEKLFYEEGKPMQRVRYLEARQARYNYHTHLFLAEDVRLWRYQYEGHEAMVDHREDAVLLMHAIAEKVEFTLEGDSHDFIAHHLKAILKDEKDALWSKV